MDVVTNSRIRMKNEAINSYAKSKGETGRKKEDTEGNPSGKQGRDACHAGREPLSVGFLR